MSEIKSFPNNQTTYVGAEWVMRWLHGRTSGVFGANGNAAVTAVANSMNVRVSDGIGWLSNSEGNGIVWWNDSFASTGSQLTLAIDMADAALNRIDRVIVEWATTNYVALPEIKILKGVLSSNPVAPSLTNNTTKRQISLARISIPAGTVSLNAGLITDERLDQTVCGLVTESVAVDTTTIQAQMESLLATIQNELEEINQASGAVVSINGKSGVVTLDTEDIGALNASDVEYKIYNSVADLGLTVGSATISGAWSAMPLHSILICPRSDFSASEQPVDASGYIEIVKVGENGDIGRINYYGRGSSTGDYKMHLSSSGVPDGAWVNADNAWKNVWTNSSPTSSFSSRTISLDLSKFSEVMIIFRAATGASDVYQTRYITPINGVSALFFGITGLASPTAMSVIGRYVTVAHTGVTIGDARQKAINSTSAGTTTNTVLIPVEILAR